MKFSTAKEHRDFFQQQGWIEFEGLIPKTQLQTAKSAIAEAIKARLPDGSRDPSRSKRAEESFIYGRDLWRSHPFLHKLATSPRLAEIAVELLEKRPLRLAYDQYFPQFFEALEIQPQLHSQTQVYAHFLQTDHSLQACSCIQGIVAGLVIALESRKESFTEIKEPSSTPSAISIFPKTEGNVLYFKGDLPIDWRFLFDEEPQNFYLIAYTQANSHYRLEPADPHTHALKKMGYIFNDKLTDKLHPIVYR